MNSEVLVVGAMESQKRRIKAVVQEVASVHFEEVRHLRTKLISADRIRVIIHVANQPDIYELSQVLAGIGSREINAPLIVLSVHNERSFERYARLNGVFYFAIYPCPKHELKEAITCACNMFDPYKNTMRWLPLLHY